MASVSQGQCGVSEKRGRMEVTMISHGVQISIAGGVEEAKDV